MLGVMLLGVKNQFLISWNKVRLMATEENRFPEVFYGIFSNFTVFTLGTT